MDVMFTMGLSALPEVLEVQDDIGFAAAAAHFTVELL